MKNSVKLIFASALLLTAASCAKDVALQVPGESPVRFDVGVDGTKATLINAATDAGFTSFSVIAYEGSEKKMDKVPVTKSGTAWTYDGECLWKKGTAMKFFGYYPQALATTLSSRTTKDGISAFTYSPLKNGGKDVNGQTDYMLATYSGNGTSSGTVSLKFTHPLASVNFVVGTFYSGVTINKIAIGGFYTSATCAPTANNDGCTYEWSGQTGVATDGALSQTLSSQSMTSGTTIGTPFVLIPQTFTTENSLTVLLTITENSVSKTLLATITSGTLEQGKTTTYTINYTDKELTITSSDLTAYGENTDDDIFKTLPPGALPGVFRVSATKTVQFSRGNLQATYSSSSSNYTWGFAANQYDYIGNAAGNTSIDSQIDGAVVDLFGWVGESSTSFTSPPQIYGISTSMNDDYYGNSDTDKLKADWGTAIDDKGTWRTLSDSEWGYLINTRTVNGDRGEGKSYQRATINSDAGGGVYGMILYPDDYTSQTSATSYTCTEWAAMEQAGCVFLPFADFRGGSSVISSRGCYWSSTAYSGNYAYNMEFDSGGVFTGHESERFTGYSVRLITESK